MKIFILLFCLSPLMSQAQNIQVGFIDSFLNAASKVDKFNGNVLVAQSGKVIYQKSFGYRNYDTRELLDENSIFELASVSKQFTAVGILLLKEKGLLKLSDSLRKFSPELPYHYITIQHMLTHTSGLPDYESAMDSLWDRKKIAFNKDVIDFLAAHPTIPPLFKPGEKCVYSNTAYAMLASIIEKVSGKTFREYMQENIFGPIGMGSSRVYNTRRSAHEVIPNYAYGFVHSDSLKKFMLPDSLPSFDFVIYLDGIQGDGVINSTTGDLYKWDRALKNHTILGTATQQEMFTPHAIFDTATKVNYGYGEFLGENEIGKYIAHSGGWPGYRTYLIRYVKEDITIIILSNNESNSSILAGALAYIATNRTVVVPYQHQPAQVNSKSLEKFVGKYSIPEYPLARTIKISLSEGKLLYSFIGTPISGELIPESSKKFFSKEPRQFQLEFRLDSRDVPVIGYYIIGGMVKRMSFVKN